MRRFLTVISKRCMRRVVSLRQNRSIDQARVKQIFIDRMQAEMVLHYAWSKKRESSLARCPRAVAGRMPHVERATQTASLAASVYRRQSTGERMLVKP